MKNTKNLFGLFKESYDNTEMKNSIGMRDKLTTNKLSLFWFFVIPDKFGVYVVSWVIWIVYLVFRKLKYSETNNNLILEFFMKRAP